MLKYQQCLIESRLPYEPQILVRIQTKMPTPVEQENIVYYKLGAL